MGTNRVKLRKQRNLVNREDAIESQFPNSTNDEVEGKKKIDTHLWMNQSSICSRSRLRSLSSLLAIGGSVIVVTAALGTLPSFRQRHNHGAFNTFPIPRLINKWSNIRNLKSSTSQARNFPKVIMPFDEGMTSLPEIRIAKDDHIRYEDYRYKTLKSIDKKHLDSEYIMTSDLADEPQEECRRVNWYSSQFPNCNSVHELTLARLMEDRQDGPAYNITYLRSGSYRDAWRYKIPGVTDFVLKRLRIKHSLEFDTKNLWKIQKEAIIFQVLSASPNILDIYGHCGTSVMIESMARDIHTQIIPGEGYANSAELKKLPDVYPNNTFTPEEKLDIALQMAESLADLHGYNGGVITHQDTHIEQWLQAHDGSVKLNDFNNAKIELWSDRRQAYCKRRGHYGGMYRSPEEFQGDGTLDEKVDVYAFGNNIYTLLTGLWPFYDDPSYSRAQERLLRGERPFVDPRYRTRSYIEANLIAIMEKCWEHKRKRRINIFSVVKFLRKVKESTQRPSQKV